MIDRKEFFRRSGHALGLAVLGTLGARMLMNPSDEAEFIAQGRRFAWQIDPDKCQSCGLCATTCVRKPSAVKAVNDPKKCSNCVVCYGHITDSKIDSEKIDSEGKRVCPVDAVVRENFSGGKDGMFLYANDLWVVDRSGDEEACIDCGNCVERCEVGALAFDEHDKELKIDYKRCIGCGQCTKRCNEYGSQSMFLMIRPDLCLGCNECAIAVACPHAAIERVPRETADDYRGDYYFDTSDFLYDMGEDA